MEDGHRGSHPQAIFPLDYRPISLLCIISKIMETLVNRHIVNYFEDHHLLTSHQFGFRGGLGTSDTLQALQTGWGKRCGLWRAARILAVDITGAFDRVSHVGLLHEMRSLGINGLLQRWLASSLDTRSLQCLVGGVRHLRTRLPLESLREAFLDQHFSRRTSTTRQMFLLTSTATAAPGA